MVVFTWKTFAELFDASGHLFLTDALILLPLGLRLESLPGQRAPIEVHEHVAERLEIVASTLLHAHVRVDGRVAGRARQVLVLSVGDVLMSARVAEFFGEAKVDYVDEIALFS